MSENFKIDSLKYHIMIAWPPMCRSRSTQTLKDRPDLVYKINEHTTRIIDICKTYKNPIKIDRRIICWVSKHGGKMVQISIIFS